jgi:transcriptional regulator with XRE-family HTH domain
MIKTPSHIWRTRLEAAIEASDMSKREISIAAGLGENYVQQMLRDGKEPSVSSLIAIATALDISMSSLFDDGESS